MDRELERVCKCTSTLDAAQLADVVSKLLKDCYDCLQTIGCRTNTDREEQMDRALSEGNMRLLFKLDQGNDMRPIPTAASLAVPVTTREEYRQKCDEEAAVLRRAGADRPLSTLIGDFTNVWGDTTIYLPLPTFTQDHCPNNGEISMCFHHVNLDTDAADVLARLVQNLWKMGKEKEQFRHLLLALTRTTSVEEIQRVTTKWFSKAKGVSPFSISTIFCLPEVYGELLVAVTKHSSVAMSACVRCAKSCW